MSRRIAEQTRKARAGGALRSIRTEPQVVEHRGVSFVVRVLAGIIEKDAATASGINPFLPYEEEMFVDDISPTHIALLNKFNVIDHHLLIVTREYEDQEELLTLEDFEALWSCMNELGGLGFYNGGEIAGASQPHKHLQVVPLPFAEEQTGLPIDPVIDKQAPSFPFAHVVMRNDLTSPETGLENYRTMLQTVDRETGPYNLLVTQSWMLLVPRSKHAHEGIPVNALGFAGSLFVRNKNELHRVRELGPMNILREVGVASVG